MKKMILVSLVTGFVTTLVSAQEVAHIVKIGETLSGILSERGLYPIYGPNGQLAQTLELNPKLKNNGNLIFPGQQILFAETAKVTRRTEKDEQTKTSEPVDPRTQLSSADSPPKDEFSGSTANDTLTLRNAHQLNLDVSLGVNFFRINGSDHLLMGNATILSQPGPNLTLGMTMDWDEQNQLRTEVGYQKYTLQDLNDGRRFTKNSDNRLSVSLFYYRKLTSRLTLGLGAKFAEEVFFRAVSLNEVAINKAFIAKPTLSAKYEDFQKDNFGVGAYGDLSYLSSAKTSDFDIHSGTGTEFGVYSYYRSLSKQNDGLIAKAGYTYEMQDTSISEQKKSDLTFKIGYQWGLDW